MNAETNGKSSTPPSSVELHYIKSSNFRVVHCDGVWGGLTPRGNIAMNCFSERSAIPTKVEHKLTPDGSLGEEILRESKGGVVREIEIEVLLDMNMAKSVLAWLTDRVAEAEERVKPKERGQ